MKLLRNLLHILQLGLFGKGGDIPEALLEGDSRLAHAMISNSFDYVSDSQNRNDLHAHINSVLDDERYPLVRIGLILLLSK